MHSIPLLYDQIPEKYKERLSDIYSARMGVVRLAPADFRSQLVEKANSIFLEWRYVHETRTGEARHLNVAIVQNLIIAAQLLAAEVKKGSG